MTTRGRGSTGAGRRAAVPAGTYEPPAAVEHTTAGGLTVRAVGEDGREIVLPVEQMPLAGWHEHVATALARYTGPAGRRRTRASVHSSWGSLGRLMRFLDQLPHRPETPSALTAAHLEDFRVFRSAAVGHAYAWNDLREAGRVLLTEPLRLQMAVEIVDYLSRRDHATPAPKPGFSDAELHRLVSAARSDVVAIRRRISTGRALVRAYRQAPDTLAPEQRQLAEQLADIAETGVVPVLQPPGGIRERGPARLAVAEHLFLTPKDLAPLLVLLAAVTGRNVETIKELPAEHRALAERAVELRIAKRRRGAGRWWETVTWEIGRPDRQLHTPGGFYLLLLDLTADSRQRSGARSIWSIWRNGHRRGDRGLAEHIDPFARDLAYNLYADRWAARHDLLTDDGQPLPVNFNRIKTSLEVRRTQQLGGHLPSAARTNTMPVLFRNYLRNDPTTIAWAHTVLDEALRDAEQAALDAHQRALATAGGRLRVHPGPDTREVLEHAGLDPATAGHVSAGTLDTAWSACADHDSHPATGKPCHASFLTCFHCGNCVITRAHLPRLLALLDALDSRRQHLAHADWWARYGPTWAAIRHDVLSKFSPAEREAAAADKPDNALLDLVENPWEQP